MSSYQHILIATDLSPESDDIINKVKHLSSSTGAQISLVHVVENSPMVYGSGEFALPIDVELESSLQQEAQQFLENQAVKHDIIPRSLSVVVGARKDEIINIATKIECDLIVVGAHDKQGLALLMGSTADSLLHALPCDILAIKVDQDEE